MGSRFSRIAWIGWNLSLILLLTVAVALFSCTKTRDGELTIGQKALSIYYADPNEKGSCCITSSQEKCAECIKRFCVTDCGAAGRNPIAVELLGCVADCRENDEACFERCKAHRPEGLKDLLFLDVEGCAGTNCFSECGY